MTPKKNSSRKPLNRPPFLSKRGYWEITRDGKKQRMHRYVYEKAHGPIPPGYHIHHIDGNKANYSLDNLECLPASTHMRRHKLGRHPSHIVLPDGTVAKLCLICCEPRPVEELYTYCTPAGTLAYRPYCRTCFNRTYGWASQQSAADNA